MCLEHVLKPMGLLVGDEATCELEHGEIVGRDALPADEQPSEPVVPTVGALDDPAPRFSAHAPDESRLTSSTDVWDDPATSNGGFRVSVVVALVQAQVLGASRAAWCAQHNCVQDFCNHPLVVDVCTRDHHRQGNATTVGQDVAFHAEFRAVRRIRPRVAPPFGALAMALSSEAKSHLMPRRLS